MVNGFPTSWPIPVLRPESSPAGQSVGGRSICLLNFFFPCEMQVAPSVASAQTWRRAESEQGRLSDVPLGSLPCKTLCWSLGAYAAPGASCQASGLGGVEFRAGVISRESFIPAAPHVVYFIPAWCHCRHAVTLCTMLLSGRERRVPWRNPVFELDSLPL